MTTIYALSDPTTGEIRYVGKTVQPPDVRLAQHVAHAGRGASEHRACWLRKVGRPAIRPMVVVPDTFAAEMERRVIAHFKAKGYRLLNLTDGGDGAPGVRPGAETRARMSASAKWRGLSPAFEAARRSLPHSIRRGMTGLAHTSETKRRISEAQRGKPRPYARKSKSPETRARMAASARARWAAQAARKQQE